MDACARIRGVPLRTRASIRKETVRDSGAQCVKSLLRNRKELCGVGVELHTRDTTWLTEIHFVCLPGHSEGEDLALQALACLPGELGELLASVHVHSLRDDEVLLLKDSRGRPPPERKDPAATQQQQSWLKTVCVLRHSPGSAPGPQQQVSVGALVGLLGRYAAGVRYALELQALHRGAAEPSQPEDDDTNQSVSSIEDDFVTALEHLEEEDHRENTCGFTKPLANTSGGMFHHGNQRDVASQTVPAHRRRKDLSGSRVIISSSSKRSSAKQRAPPEVSVTVQRSSGVESQWTLCSPRARLPSPSAPVSESDSDCSSPSPIIFLDEVGYQKSLRAKLDIPQVPGGPRERVEDSDSEVSEFFDSFDQFDDLDELSSESCTLTLPLDPGGGGGGGAEPTAKKRHSEAGTSVSGSKYVSRSSSTRTMNPHRFDQPTLPANVKKPTPLKPGSPYSPHPEVPDSPRPVRTSCEESGGPLFSPVSASAFSPLADSVGALEYFWKKEEDEGDGLELRKPQDLCSLYKTYSDFASSLSKEILASVCGYQSPVDISDNKNLSCVCHKEFQNPSGHLMKLWEIQETVTVARLQQTSQSLKDGIQRFAADLVETSLGSALRDLQKGVSSCTTTLCHLAARLTSSVFQMAFQEIGMRRAYVLKERAVSGLAGFLAGEVVSGALKDFLSVRKQMFNSAVARFAADLAEELVFEGMMEVCQFSHPSTPLGPGGWFFVREEDEEVVSSYASDLSESVLQEAFIELSQADVAFTTQAAISVSLDNICYVSSEGASHTCSTVASHRDDSADASPGPSVAEDDCTVKKALFSVSGMASCVPVPQAGQALSGLQGAEETCQYKSSLAHTSQTSPRSSSSCQGRVVTTASSDTTAATQTDLQPASPHLPGAHGQGLAPGSGADPSLGKTPFHSFSGNMVDMIVSEACELITATKVKKRVEDCADFLSKSIGGRGPSTGQGQAVSEDASESRRPEHRHASKDPACVRRGSASEQAPPIQTLASTRVTCESGSGSPHPHPASKAVPTTTTKDALNVPGAESGGGTPGTPPSTPQQPSEVSQERQIKRFSKKLKGKLAKEFSPATPPSTPHYQPEPGPGARDPAAENAKADFLLKLMRSLSEEAEGNEEEEEEEEEEEDADVRGGPSAPEAGGQRSQPHLSAAVATSTRKVSNKEAFHYAERLACHIVSMATEMDTLGVAGDDRGGREEARRGSVAQFSEQTLNTLWVYAGEVAGEVISDVKRMVGSGDCRHRGVRRGQDRSGSDGAHRRHHQPHLHSAPGEHSRDCRLGRLAEQWSADLLGPVLQLPAAASAASARSGPGSGLSSEYPSCESVTDEYAGYLIRVLKKEGGNRELVLDQYASRLAYRSIKLGLAHAARNTKQRPSAPRLRPASSRRGLGAGTFPPGDGAWGAGYPSGEAGQCACRDPEDGGPREDYAELVSFAESLAYGIARDVARKLRQSTAARLPKSLTDSCLYKRARLEDMTEDLIRSSFSCPLLAKEGKSRRYHSTGSLCDDGAGGCSGAMRVIEHYARKIADDTLEMTLASAGRPAQELRRGQGQDRRPPHAQRLSEGAGLDVAPGKRECPFCSRPGGGGGGGHLQPAGQRRRRQACDAGAGRLCGLEIPEIHVDLDRRAAFAEEMVTTAMETAKRELSNTSLNADSGIGHDGASFAESLTAEIMTSALSNACQTANLSSPGREAREATESTVSQQLSLSVGDDSWSNLSFEDDHPDETSSFLHLSDSSNGNSSSWSSLGLEGEACEEHLSFSYPSDSDCTEDKETEVKEESCGTVRVDRGQSQAHRALLVVNSEVREPGHHDLRPPNVDPQLRSLLQWTAASMVDLPLVQLGTTTDMELQQLPAVVQRLREREWRVGDLLQALLRYGEETGNEPPRAGREARHTPLFQWLLEHA